LSLDFNETMPSGNGSMDRPPTSPNPFASGSVLFAKRKRNLFKGPMLSFGGQQHQPSPSSSRPAGHSRSASGSGLGRRSGELPIQEEDEDFAEVPTMEEEEEIEEVEQFSPIIRAPGEIVEEIYEEDEEDKPVVRGALLQPAPIIGKSTTLAARDVKP